MLKSILIGGFVIMLDIAVYMLLSLLLMSYDDFYDESKGEYWSLSSMNMREKVTYIGLDVWNFINLIAIGYVIYRIARRFRKKE